MTTHITATVQKDGAWWLVTVPEYDIVGQAAHLKDATEVAKEITALWLDEDEDNITVTIHPVLPEHVRTALAEADTESVRAKELAAQAAERRATAVIGLLDDGMNITEASKMMGLSRQRVSQIIESGGKYTRSKRRVAQGVTKSRKLRTSH